MYTISYEEFMTLCAKAGTTTATTANKKTITLDSTDYSITLDWGVDGVTPTVQVEESEHLSLDKVFETYYSAL